MDAKSSAILSSYQSSLAKDDSDISDTDSLLELLNDDTDPVFSAYREQRTQQLAQELKQSQIRASDAARVETLTSESELFDMAISMDSSSLDSSSSIASTNTNTPKLRQDSYRSIIIHFFHPDFRTCKLLDDALTKLAATHFNTTKIVRINAVTNAPFLTSKFGLRVLPAVLGFKDGKMVAKFSGLDRFIDPKTMAKLAVKADVNNQSASSPGKPTSPMDNIKELNVDWIENELIKVGLLFRNTGNSIKNDYSDDEQEYNKKRSIRGSTKSSWTRSVKTHEHDESDDDDGLDL